MDAATFQTRMIVQITDDIGLATTAEAGDFCGYRFGYREFGYRSVAEADASYRGARRRVLDNEQVFLNSVGLKPV